LIFKGQLFKLRQELVVASSGTVVWDFELKLDELAL
jgi:hypothetical protein